jgi:PIN domain nuclease of toxin-antitoxin system
MKVSVAEAKNTLPKLIKAVEDGEPVTICRHAMSALRKETAVREISVVSLCEIAVKQISGKLTFGKAAAIAGIADLRLRVLPYSAEHVPAVRPHHADPFDRQIMTQALLEKVTVVTPDDAFSLYEDLKVVW